jgi:hypothetical protein
MQISNPAPRLLLCFVTANQDLINASLEYWELRRSGTRWNWAFGAKNIAERHKMKTGALARSLQENALAFDLNVRCRCGRPRHVKSRAQAVQSLGSYRCDECLRVMYHQMIGASQKRSAEAKENARRKMEELLARTHRADYSSISFFDTVIVFTLMLISDSACERGEFSGGSIALCCSRAATERLLHELLGNGILAFSPETRPDAITCEEEGKWTYTSEAVVWRLVEDSSGRSFPEVFELLGQLIDAGRARDDYKELAAKLWWVLAIDDASSFLQAEIGRYQNIAFRAGPKTDYALRYSLERFSIPQVRRHIRHVVEKAVALRQNREFGKVYALNTIPGSLISRVDRAIADNWMVYPLLQEWDCEPALLRTVFQRVLKTGMGGFRLARGSDWPI